MIIEGPVAANSNVNLWRKNYLMNSPYSAEYIREWDTCKILMLQTEKCLNVLCRFQCTLTNNIANCALATWRVKN